jgi:hypothetical protein
MPIRSSTKLNLFHPNEARKRRLIPALHIDAEVADLAIISVHGQL